MMDANTHKIYEQRVIAFVDILGWKDACKTESVRLKDAAEAIYNAAKGYNVTTKEEIKRLPNIIPNPIYLKVQVGAFSDNFAISMPANFGYRIIDGAAEVCRKLLLLGFLTRGGITVGDVYHIDNMIFGPALIEAVSLEREAVYPRLVCSPKLIDHLEQIGPDPAECIVVDHLGRRIANLFEVYGISTATGQPKNVFESEISAIETIIEDEIQRYSNDKSDNRAEKWRYMRDVLPIMLSCYNQ
jgi:hypothetical protein